jgi:hypothetical protein
VIEIREDLWRIPCNWVCIPTNGIVKKDGSAVMGAGVALEAVQKQYDLPYLLGEAIQKHGNQVHLLKKWTRDYFVPVVDPNIAHQDDKVVVSLFSFPTKEHYRDNSSLVLIEKSCKQILSKYNTVVFQNKNVYDKAPRIPKVVIPRPGCGFGGLNWEKQVKPICEKYLTSDDFIICHK